MNMEPCTGHTVSVSSLNPRNIIDMVIGIHRVRDHKASPDREWLSKIIGQNLHRPCEVEIETLSRDECEFFDYEDGVAFKGGPNNPIMPGTTLSWWHISKMDNIEEQVKNGYRQIVGEFDIPPRIEQTEPLINALCTSDLFSDSFSRGYIARLCQEEDGNVPNARYHCGLNELITSYKKLLGIGGVQFRIHGSTFYPCETMHSVLICPSRADLAGLKERNILEGLDHHLARKFPPMAVFAAGHDRPALTARVFMEVDANGRYRIIWRPWCTRSKDEGTFLQWDNLTVAFLLPECLNGWPCRLPLPLPYSRQDKLVPIESRQDKFDTNFDNELIRIADAPN